MSVSVNARPLSRSILRRLDAQHVPQMAPLDSSRGRVQALLTVAMIVVPVAALTVDHQEQVELLWAVLLAVVCVVAEFAVNDARRFSRRASLRPTDAVVTACLVWHPGTYLLLSLALSSVVAGMLWRREPRRILWVTARDTMALTIGLLAVDQIESHFTAKAIVAMVVAAATLAGMFRLERTLSGHRSVPGSGTRSLFYFGVMVSLGALAGHVVPEHPVAIVLFVLPFVGVLLPYGGRRSQIDERAVLNDLLLHVSQAGDEVSLQSAARAVHHGAELAFAAKSTTVSVTVYDPTVGVRVERDAQGDVVTRHLSACTTVVTPPESLEGAPYAIRFDRLGGSFTALLGNDDALVGLLEVTWAGRPVYRKRSAHLGLVVAELGGSWIAAALVHERTRVAEDLAAAARSRQAASALRAEMAPALAALNRATRGLADLAARQSAGEDVDLSTDIDAAAQAVAALAGAAAQAVPEEVPADKARVAAARSDAQEPSVRLGTLPLGITR